MKCVNCRFPIDARLDSYGTIDGKPYCLDCLVKVINVRSGLAESKSAPEVVLERTTDGKAIDLQSERHSPR